MLNIRMRNEAFGIIPRVTKVYDKTDYPALRWILSLVEKSGKPAHWRLQWLEFDIDIVHYAVSKHQSTDVHFRMSSTGSAETLLRAEVLALTVDVTDDRESGE